MILPRRVQLRTLLALVAHDHRLVRRVCRSLNAVSVLTTLEQFGDVALRLAGTLTVMDSGPGIDAEFLPFAFDPFRQAGGGRVRVNRGVGLGLAIVRQLTEMHGGTVVAFKNSSGVGATVRLSFPIVVLSAADHEADAAATNAEGRRQHPASQRVV